MAHSPVFAQTPAGTYVKADKIQTNMPIFSSIRKPQADENGNLIGYKGINFGLGYSSDNYYKPVKVGEWNSFWRWGTVLVAIPYIGVGTDYYLTETFYIGVGTFYFIPELHFSVNF
ncbi:hypothetical protein OAJ27_00095 [bacterium]|nr:hypothetical protein [bacterium]